MTYDIVERLRDLTRGKHHDLMVSEEAAYEIERLRRIIDTIHPQMQATIDRLTKDNADISAACKEGWDQARKRQSQIRNLEAERDEAVERGNDWCDQAKKARAERDRLRSGWLVSIQTENSCVTTGQPCRVRCGCALEQEALANVRATLKETGHEADQ